MAATAASTAASASTARPRFVWSTVPLRLKSGRELKRSSRSRRARLSVARRSAVGTALAPSCKAARATSIVARIASVEAFWPNRSRRSVAAEVLRTAYTEGRSRRRASIAGSIVPSLRPWQSYCASESSVNHVPRRRPHRKPPCFGPLPDCASAGRKPRAR